ncbi:MAG: 5'-nucleotidase [Armatimonadota bacterium]|nr:5'-nucleotidase [Armatimonadota bacterium]
MSRIWLIVITVVLTLSAVFGLGGFGVYAATTNSELTNKDSGTSETEFGDFVADAIRAQVKAEIGFITASELKEVTISKGDVSTSDVVAALSYQNDPVVLLTLNGDQVRRALERSVAIYPQKNLGFLQVSGIRFTFDPGKPKESRVVSVTVGGKPLDPSASYSVGVTSSLGNGALGYFRVWEKDQITSVTKTSLSQAVANFLQATQKLDYKRDRITVLK